MIMNLMYKKKCGGCKGSGRWGRGRCAACKGRGGKIDRKEVSFDAPELKWLLDKVVVLFNVRDVMEYTFTDARLSGFEGFLFGMLYQHIAYGKLSEKQIGVLKRSMEKDIQRAEAKAKEAESFKLIPEGAICVSGEVVSVKEEVNRYAYNGEMVYKILVQCDGYRLFGTCPRSLMDEPEIVGKKVRFEANVKAKEAGFGFFSRPKNASYTKF